MAAVPLPKALAKSQPHNGAAKPSPTVKPLENSRELARVLHAKAYPGGVNEVNHFLISPGRIQVSGRAS